MIEFEVVDNQTGRYPDCEKIALTEDWAKHLIYCDIDCFAVTEDGALLLIDDCNNIAYPPSDRFTVKFDPESLRPKGRCKKADIPKKVTLDSKCEKCDTLMLSTDNFCPNCGANMEGK